MITEISSFSNPKVKYIKSLSKSRNRREEQLFLMEGRPELDHAFDQGLKAQFIAYSDSYISDLEIAAFVDIDKTQIYKLSKAIFDDLTYQNVPENFLACFKTWSESIDQFDSSAFTIILEKLEKPGNLGAIIRTCDALGVKQIIVSDSEIDLFNPNVLRNCRGGIFNVKIAFCDNETTLGFINKHKWNVAATVLSNHAKDYKTFEKSDVDALLFGPESSGLSSFWLDQKLDHMIIPMRGIVDSLNLSVSTAILMAHFVD